jgi:D-alanyl-D-alanine carboxypeptidase
MAWAMAAGPALANPTLVIDVDSGQVLSESQSTANWYPASLTKLMTVYVALHAVRDGRVAMDTPFVVSARAANMPASKMGFKPGVEVTLDNALKMLMVKSPNDVAVTVAEGVSGSVEAFADEMNAAAARLGLRESHFVNPNGLPDARQVSSARDMALIGRALLKEFPEHSDLFGIGALQLGDQIIRTHNGLIGRYPGADGMKTGFTCAAGFNVVASATHGGRRLIAVVLGSPSARERTAEAAALLDKAFNQWGGGRGPLENLPSPGVGAAPDMHQEICSRRGRLAIAAGEEEELTTPIALESGKSGARGASMYAPALPAAITPLALAAMAPAHFDPVPVFVGPKPGWTGPVAAARPADAATPPEASAFAPVDNPPTLDPNETPPLTAPIALHNAVPPGVKPAAAKASVQPTAKPPATRVADRSKPKTKGAVVAAPGKSVPKSEAAEPASVPPPPPAP